MEEDDEDEESIHPSYCSSDDEIDVRLSPRAALHPDTLSGRMKRILLWREQSPQLLSGWCFTPSYILINFKLPPPQIQYR